MPAGEPASTLMLLSDHCGHYSQKQFIHNTYTILQIYKTIGNTNVYGYRCYDSGKHQWLAGIFHGCSDFIQRVLFGNVTNPRARPQILASNGLATKVIENALCPRALTIPYMVLNFTEKHGSAMELSNGTGCEDLTSWWRLVTTIVKRSFVRLSESGCLNREVLP